MKILKRVIIFFVIIFLNGNFSGCHNSKKADSNEHEGSEQTALQDQHGGNEHTDEIVLKPDMLKEANLEIVPILKREFRQLKTYPATVVPRPDGDAHVGSLIAGRVMDIYKRIGDKVVKGSALCRIESPEISAAQAAYLRAATQYELAKKELNRYEKLKAEDIGSEKNLLEKEATVRASQTELSAAERTLYSIGFSKAEIDSLLHDYRSPGILKLKSPIDGVITDWWIKLGQRVNPEQDLFHILDLSPLWVQIALYEKDLVEVKLNQPVNIIPPSLPNLIFQGKITQIGREVNKETRTINCYVEVPNHQETLIPNLFVNCQLQTGAPGDLALAVPEEAIVIDANGDQSVFVELEPNHFVPRDVKTGRNCQGWIEILDGLKEGERVVFKGAFFIKSEAAKGSFGHGHAH